MVIAASIALALMCTPVFAKDVTPFEAVYEVENNYITGGLAWLRLAPDNKGRFVFSLQSKPTGIFKWTKNGNIREQAVLSSLTAPFIASEYSYTDKGRPERSYSVQFDRKAGSMELAKGDTSTTHDVDPGVVDRLSVTLALLHRANTDPDFKRLEVDVLDGSSTETVAYSNRGTETVRTAIGEFNATRILKDRVNSTRETVIWLAQVGNPEIVLPLRIEQYKKGKLSLRLNITGLKSLD